MSIDAESIRRAIREEIERDRKEQERDARDKQRDLDIAELREQLKRKPKDDHEAEPKEDDHDFVG